MYGPIQRVNQIGFERIERYPVRRHLWSFQQGLFSEFVETLPKCVHEYASRHPRGSIEFGGAL